MVIRVTTYTALLGLVILAGPSGAQSDASDAATSEIRDALAVEIDRFEGDLATLRELAAWQSDLLRAARVDPDAALRQRRPINTCLNTVLAPICAQLPALFRAETRAQQATPTPNGAGGPGSGRASE